MKQMIVLLFAVVFLAACRKDVQQEPTKNEKFQVDIRSPQERQVYHKGDTILIAVDISSDLGLHEYRVTISEGAKVLFDRGAHSHAKDKSLEWLWINTADSKILNLEVLATDHNLNKFSKSCAIYNEP